MAETPTIEWWKLGATIVLALLAAAIAIRQTVIARQKFRLDLFEKREPIFELACKLCSLHRGTSSSSQGARNLARAELQNACPRAGFLFGAKMEAYLRDLLAKAAEMDDSREVAASSGDLASGSGARKVMHEGLRFFGNETAEGCKARFAPYLEFGKWS